MARVVETDTDLLKKIKEKMYRTRLKIRSGSTPEAVDWSKLFPFRVGTRHFRSPEDVRNLVGNQYFQDKYVRVRQKGLHKSKAGYDGHYDMLVDIYDVMEGAPGAGNQPIAIKIPVDSSLCFFNASKKKPKKTKKSKKSKKRDTRRKKTKNTKRSKKRTKKKTKQLRAGFSKKNWEEIKEFVMEEGLEGETGYSLLKKIDNAHFSKAVKKMIPDFHMTTSWEKICREFDLM